MGINDSLMLTNNGNINAGTSLLCSSTIANQLVIVRHFGAQYLETSSDATLIARPGLGVA